ncbi:DUF2892 domain-containing protein [Algoriphagus sp.]|uniref:YgaP family membrane protein n=1 Tax=Algoriphagus sp. TaxID=1872435 RepID=UPI00261BE34E|nr:DUF2892 domain-containing protein [Algoriphagus sp.]
MGSTDRGLRLFVAAILVGLFFSSVLTGALGIVALVVATVLTLTTLIGFCPLYTLLGINTRSPLAKR